jgi:hypothetical protein
VTDQPEPMTFPGNDDPSIQDATDHVVETWNDAAPGKDPNATADDFQRMRDGFGELADRTVSTDD